MQRLRATVCPVSMSLPEPAPEAPDQQLMRSHLHAAAAAPTGVFPRLGWIASKSLETFLHPWTYLLLLGYVLTAGFIWLLGMLIGGFVTLLTAEVIVLSGGSANFAGFIFGLFWFFGLLSLGLIYTGYIGGSIRMLAPMIAGRSPDAMAFPAGVLTQGPRLLVVFCAALLLASVPVWLLIQFVIEMLQEYGWATISSSWNRSLQWWILGQLATRLAAIAATLAVMNLLLAPWQTVVGIRRVNPIGGLGLTFTTLISQLPVSLIVLTIFGLAQYGLNAWSETSFWGAMFVTLLLTPPATLAMLCLVASDYEPDARQSRTPVRRAPFRSTSAPQGGPPPSQPGPPPPSNPVPGLLPNR